MVKRAIKRAGRYLFTRKFNLVDSVGLCILAATAPEPFVWLIVGVVFITISTLGERYVG